MSKEFGVQSDRVGLGVTDTVQKEVLLGAQLGVALSLEDLLVYLC